MVYQQTMETLARGGMYNYFMFYSGTNFGFWVSTTWKSDQSFITTRYYGRAPLAEGGALNDSYFAAKAANLLACNFQEFLTASEEAPNLLVFDGPVRVEAVRTPLGCLLFVHPRFPVRDHTVYRMDGRGPVITLEEEWPMAELATQPGTSLLPSGDRVELAEQSSYPSMLPFQLNIDSGCRIDYSNTTLMGVAGAPNRRILILRGDPGRRGIVSVNGKPADFVLPSSGIARLETGGVTVLALPRALADRAWFADGRVLIGPAYVGAMQNGKHECFIDGRTVMISRISSQGEMQTKKVDSAPDLTFQMPLKDWTSRPLPQLLPLSEGWRELDHPVGVEELGAYWGYTWYRASFTSQEPRTTSLVFTEASDRIHVFVNGKRMGIWGRGQGAVRDPLPVEIIAGENQFVFLCDNMGRLSEGKCLDRKGIRGPAYLDAAIRPPTPGNIKPIEAFGLATLGCCRRLTKSRPVSAKVSCCRCVPCRSTPG